MDYLALIGLKWKPCSDWPNWTINLYCLKMKALLWLVNTDNELLLLRKQCSDRLIMDNELHCKDVTSQWLKWCMFQILYSVSNDINLCTGTIWTLTQTNTAFPWQPLQVDCRDCIATISRNSCTRVIGIWFL